MAEDLDALLDEVETKFCRLQALGAVGKRDRGGAVGVEPIPPLHPNPLPQGHKRKDKLQFVCKSTRTKNTPFHDFASTLVPSLNTEIVVSCLEVEVEPKAKGVTQGQCIVVNKCYLIYFIDY
uniref:Uncharacterized protein n=1 Tax=Chelonoidis abingdonii TaxID=106734 RepID=A0A8C0J379_CHEAB